MCFRNPPVPFTYQGQDPNMGQVGLLTTATYPPVAAGTRACGEFEAGNRVAVAQTLPKLSIAI